MRLVALLTLPLWVGWAVIAPAQPLTAVTTRFTNSFQEWTLHQEGNEYAGELRRRWQSTEDWTAWDYRLGEHTGQMVLKWSGNANEWEVRGDNVIVSARTIWNNDFSQWRISDGRRTITLRTRYRNQPEDWEKEGDAGGTFAMYTAYRGEPREWMIADDLDEDLPVALKMAMVFIVLFHSTPKM